VAVVQEAVEAANLFDTDLVVVYVLDILFHAIVAVLVVLLEEATRRVVEVAWYGRPYVVTLRAARILVVAVLAAHNILLVVRPIHLVLVHTLELSISSLYVFL